MQVFQDDSIQKAIPTAGKADRRTKEVTDWSSGSELAHRWSNEHTQTNCWLGGGVEVYTALVQGWIWVGFCFAVRF